MEDSLQPVVTMKESLKPPLLPRFGIDALLDDQNFLDKLKGKRVGLIANQSSLTSQLIPSAYALQNLLGPSLSCLFTLEHGWSAFSAAGEVIADAHEPLTNLPVYSLYGPLFAQNVQRIQSLDYLLIDIQDVGVRSYTYAATCAKVLEHAASNAYATEFIVCDRPNPLGTRRAGPQWDPAFRSLVSYINVPYQHGKTIGELLQVHNQSLPKAAPLTIIPAESAFDPQTHLWIPPSLGLPDWHSVLLYPALVLLEGTNVSEGRGSTLPFKCVAAPKLDALKLMEILQAAPMRDSIALHPFTFTPSSGKLANQECSGVQIHLVDPSFDAFALGVYTLHALLQVYPSFEWTRLGNHEKYWIDAITGSAYLRTALSAGKDPKKILSDIDIRHDKHDNMI